MILETIFLTGLLIGGVKYWTRESAQKNASDRKPSPPKKSAPKTAPAKGQPMTKELEIASDEFSDKQIERYLKISGLATALVGAGVVVNPFFTVAGLVVFLSPTIFILKRAHQNFVKERKLTLDLFEVVYAPGLLLAGYYFTLTLSYFLYLLSLKILIKIKDRSRKTITDYYTRFSDNVWIVKDGVEIEVPFHSIQKGDIVSVKGGEIIPADGQITSGQAAVDQHILTGESLLIEKKAGDPVFSSTMVVSGTIHFRVERSGRETVVSGIADTLIQTVDYKTNKQTIGEKVAVQSILPTFALASIAYPLTGGIGSLAILGSFIGAEAQTFIPLSALNFMKAYSLHGILVKDGRSLEYLAKVDTIVFDKTGTLTTDELLVTDIYFCEAYTEKDILGFAAIAEGRQTHPIAKAILKKAEEWGLNRNTADHIVYEAGLGIKVQMPDYTIHAGSERFMEIEQISLPPEIELRLKECLAGGTSLILIAKDNTMAGAIELKITLRPEVKQIIRYLKKKKKTIFMITGDTENSAKTTAQEIGIQQYYFETFPEQKAIIIDQLLAEGRTVCYVGDGINDSIAMKKAQVSISLSGASTMARDTAGIILLDGTLRNLTRLFEIGAYFGANINNALALAIIPGLMNISSVFFLHSGIYFSLFLYYLSLSLNLANSFYPLVKFKKEKFQTIRLPHLPEEDQLYAIPKFDLDLKTIPEFHTELKGFQENFYDCFSRSEFRRFFYTYMRGQFVDLGHPAHEPIALVAEKGKIKRIRHCISDVQWDDQKLMSKYQTMIAEDLGEPNGAVIFEENGFVKKGNDYAGVGKQYCRPAEKVENCQVGVFATYVSSRGFTFLDTRLFLPEKWFSSDYQGRREIGQVPPSLTFKTKSQLAGEMLKALKTSKKVPFTWVLTDSMAINSLDFIEAVEGCEEVYYFVSTTADTPCWLTAPMTRKKQYNEGGQLREKTILGPKAKKPIPVAELARGIHDFFWFRRQVSEGAGGPIEYEFTKRRIVLSKNGLPDRTVWLILRRTLDKKPITRYFLTNAPIGTTLPTLAWLSGLHWAGEQCLEEGKAELGMGHYDVRDYQGWTHHMVSTMMAHFFLWHLKIRLGKKKSEYETYAA